MAKHLTVRNMLKVKQKGKRPWHDDVLLGDKNLHWIWKAFIIMTFFSAHNFSHPEITKIIYTKQQLMYGASLGYRFFLPLHRV